MKEQDFFYFSWINVEATSDNHVFGALHYIKVALCVHLADIASMHPAIDKNSFTLILALPVALHNIGTLHHDLAQLTHMHRLTCLPTDNGSFHVWQGQTNTPIAAFLCQRITMRNWRCF